MSSIFGGSKSKNSSSNQAYGDILSNYGGLQGTAATGTNALSALLGGDASGFNAYKQATGFDAAAKQGSQGITGNAAAAGLLRSGSSSKALQSYGDNIQNQYAGQYMNGLMNQANLGFQAGSLISGAGQQSSGSSSSKPGIGKFIGQAATGAAMFSDPRLKEDVIHIRTRNDGLKVYNFKYKDSEGRHIGLMADEVPAKFRGPDIGGYMTIDYDKAGSLYIG